MDFRQFNIGCEFTTSTGRWRVTDVGTRVVIAIKLDEGDPIWNEGPPYVKAEFVFDETDFEACELIGTQTQFGEHARY